MQDKTKSIVVKIWKFLKNEENGMSIKEIYQKLELLKVPGEILDKYTEGSLMKIIRYRSFPPLFVSDRKEGYQLAEWFRKELNSKENVMDENIISILQKNNIVGEKSEILNQGIKILYSAKDPLTYLEIFSELSKIDTLFPDGKTPKQTLNAELSRRKNKQIFFQPSLNKYGIINDFKSISEEDFIRFLNNDVSEEDDNGEDDDEERILKSESQQNIPEQPNHPDIIDGKFFIPLWKKYLSHKNLFFSDEILTRVLVSLKCNKLTVLFGPSGTGKSILAENLTDFIIYPNINENNPFYLRIAVKSNWLDNQALLGYYNPILNKYQLTDFLKFLIQAKNHAEKAKIEKRNAPWYIVCLDEMNLAHIEHYFSDFLSAMESPNKIIRLDGIGDVTKTTEDGIFNQIKSLIEIPDNFKIIGTINMDETTKRLSPKVTDRAQIIPLIEVDLEHGLAREKEDEPLLFKQISDINNRLTDSGLIIGYRVWKDIINYCRIYPQTNEKPTKKDKEEFVFHILDYQFEQKILPKLEGMKSKVERPLMNLILELLDKQKDTEKNTIIEPKNPQELSAWIKEGKIYSSIYSHTIEKAKKMWIRLQEDDVTSYYEF